MRQCFLYSLGALFFCTLQLAQFVGNAHALPPDDMDTCYTVETSASPDRLVATNKWSGFQTDIGSTGVDGISALAFPPSGTTLYAARSDLLGTLDIDTGAFQPVAGLFGIADTPAPLTLDNVVGLAWLSDKSQPNLLYAVHRRPLLPDVLFIVDRKTGAHVDNAFNGTDDYVEIDGGGSCLLNFEGLTMSPNFAVFFSIATDPNPAIDDQLVTISPINGECTVLEDPIEDTNTSLTINNWSGLSFAQPIYEVGGVAVDYLYGITNEVGADRFWQIDQFDFALPDWTALEITPLAVPGDFVDLACPGSPCDLLDLSKSHTGVAYVGGKVTYRVLWNNQCVGVNFPDVVITDTLPAGLELLSATSKNAIVTTTGNTVTIDPGTVWDALTAAGEATIKVRATTSGTFVNRASLVDGFGGRVEATDDLTVHPGKFDSSMRLKGHKKTRPGRTVTYQARYRNVDSANELVMVLPPELRPTYVFPPGAVGTDGTVVWRNLPGPSGKTKIKAVVDPLVRVPSILTVRATLSEASEFVEVDSLDTSVSDSVKQKGPSVPSLSVTGPSFLTRGLVTQLSIRYSKTNGNSNLQVTLPPEMNHVQLTIPQASGFRDGVLTWSSLPPPSGSAKVKVYLDESAVIGSTLAVTARLEDEGGFKLQAGDTMGVRR